METDKDLFKAELDGKLAQRIFKAELAGTHLFIDPELKLIIPLIQYDILSVFVYHLITIGENTDWAHNRGQNGTLEYKGTPMFDRITDKSFYLWSGWRIYHKYRHNMVCAGWIEADEKQRMTGVFNVFKPKNCLPKSYIELSYKDGPSQKHYFPTYEGDGDHPDSYLVLDTKDATKIMMCYPALSTMHRETIKKSIPGMFGYNYSIDKFRTRGHLITIPSIIR